MRAVVTNATSDAGVSVARSLCLAGFEILGIDVRPIPRFMSSRHLGGYAYIAHDDPVTWQDAVVAFLRKTRADVFLPLCTPGAVLAVQRRRELEAICRAITPDTEAFMAAYDKRLCMALCSALGIPCAGSLTRDDAAALLARGGGRSVIVKPAIDVCAGRGLRRVTVIGDLDAAITDCTSRHGGCVIQDYIPGRDDTLRMVTVVYGGTGRLIGGFTAWKLRQWPAGGGVTAVGVSTRDTALLDLVRPFFDHLAWRGPAEVELKHDARDGTYKVLEINPRLPGNLRHASLCGVEPAVLAARAALGEEPPATNGLSEYREGVAYVAPTVFVKSVLSDARSRGWRRALAPAWHEALAAGPMLREMLADPLPLVARSLVPVPAHAAAPLRARRSNASIPGEAPPPSAP